MKKTLLKFNGAQELSKEDQKQINGSARLTLRCGGDGSFIYQDGEKVCCYLPWSGEYMC